jgi:hypothetical protein
MRSIIGSNAYIPIIDVPGTWCKWGHLVLEFSRDERFLGTSSARVLNDEATKEHSLSIYRVHVWGFDITNQYH